MTDTPLPKNHAPRTRLIVVARWTARSLLVAIVGSWLFLYVDSVYQRRRAEAFVADLRSLDFSTAGFPEVRDIMIRNGGTTTKRKDEDTCTPRECYFGLQIKSQLPRIPLLGRKAIFLYTILPYIGVRSWLLGTDVEVRDGKLYTSGMGVFEYRMKREPGGAYWLVSLAYGVETHRDAASFKNGPCSSLDYQVWVDQGVMKMPADRLETCVVQSAGIPLKRAFDVHLRCLNNPFRNCRFDELAPSAWADYSAKSAGAGAGDPHQ